MTSMETGSDDKSWTQHEFWYTNLSDAEAMQNLMVMLHAFGITFRNPYDPPVEFFIRNSAYTEQYIVMIYMVNK